MDAIECLYNVDYVLNVAYNLMQTSLSSIIWNLFSGNFTSY